MTVLFGGLFAVAYGFTRNIPLVMVLGFLEAVCTLGGMPAVYAEVSRVVPASMQGRAQGLFDPLGLEIPEPADRAVEAIAADRRTFYVAATRARRRVLFTVSAAASGRGRPSRFLAGLLPHRVVAESAIHELRHRHGPQDKGKPLLSQD